TGGVFTGCGIAASAARFPACRASHNQNAAATTPSAPAATSNQPEVSKRGRKARAAHAPAMLMMAQTSPTPATTSRATEREDERVAMLILPTTNAIAARQCQA